MELTHLRVPSVHHLLTYVNVPYTLTCVATRDRRHLQALEEHATQHVDLDEPVGRTGPATGYTAVHLDPKDERHAVCTCGWSGPRRNTYEHAAQDERDHYRDSGHYPLQRDAPPDSPARQLQRITRGPVLTNPARALDRLTAIRELRAWLDDKEPQAVIGARMARATWDEIGAAWGGASRQAAYNRWGRMIKRYEQTRLLEPGD